MTRDSGYRSMYLPSVASVHSVHNSSSIYSGLKLIQIFCLYITARPAIAVHYVHMYILHMNVHLWVRLPLTPTYTIIWYGNIVNIYVFFICSHVHRNATKE